MIPTTVRLYAKVLLVIGYGKKEVEKRFMKIEDHPEMVAIARFILPRGHVKNCQCCTEPDNELSTTHCCKEGCGLPVGDHPHADPRCWP